MKLLGQDPLEDSHHFDANQDPDPIRIWIGINMEFGSGLASKRWRSTTLGKKHYFFFSHALTLFPLSFVLYVEESTPSLSGEKS